MAVHGPVRHKRKIVKDDVYMSGFHSFQFSYSQIFVQDGVHFLFSNLIKLFGLCFRYHRGFKFSEILRTKTISL